MKLLAFAAIFSALAFTSCTKDTPVAANNANAITVVPQSAVPAAIVAALNSSFAGATEADWIAFRKFHSLKLLLKKSIPL